MMRRYPFRKLPPEISLDEYFEQIILLQQLMKFFEVWVNPERPDPLTELQNYMMYLRIMSIIFDKEEMLNEAIELVKHHSNEARNYLMQQQNAAKEAIAPIIALRQKIDETVIADQCQQREEQASVLKVGFFAERAAKRQEINEWVRIHLDDIYRGVQFIKPPLARIR